MIVLVGFLLFGMVQLGYGLEDVHRAWRSSGWPQAPGKIIQSEVVPIPRGKGSRIEHRSQVVAQYRFAGRDYKTATRYVGHDPSWKEWSEDRARAICERYAVGDAVSVYYDPEDWRYGVLEPGVRRASWLAAYSGASVALVMAAILLIAWLVADDPRWLRPAR